MHQNVVIIAEYSDSKVEPVTYELAACAWELKCLCLGNVTAVVLGSRPEEAAGEIARVSGLDVSAVQVPGLEGYNAEAYKSVLSDVLSDLGASYVCVAHSTRGPDFAPGLSVRLGAACITGVERVFLKPEGICFSRSLFNGKIVAEVTPTVETTILTVQPGAFKPLSSEGGEGGSVHLRTASFEPVRSRSLGIKRGEAGDSAVAGAKVIVAAGRGLRKKENLDLIERLAALLPGSAVGGSRPVCDVGWLEYKRQVGLTGAQVTPELYVACGISGAIQHVAGMRGAGFVVSINSDPNAAMFHHSDLCIVEDLTAFIPLLIEELEKTPAV